LKIRTIAEFFVVFSFKDWLIEESILSPGTHAGWKFGGK